MTLRFTALLLALAPAYSFRFVSATKGRPSQSILIGDKTCSVLDHGAKGDGKTDDTNAIQKALDECGSAGGGQVVLPAKASNSGAKYLTKALMISHDHIELNIPSGSTLLVSNDRKNWPGENDVIGTKKDVQHIAITGSGTVDGQGAEWWLHKDNFRPKTVKFNKVKYGLISDVLFKDPPNHCLELYGTEIEVAGASVTAPPSTGTSNPSHNTDAIDVHGTPFHVHDCYFNTGDDNIAAHANHTLVENCVFGTGHGASIGSLCDVWLHNITFRNISYTGTTAGARIKVRDGCEHGRLWDVTFEDLKMKDVQTPIDVSMFYDTKRPQGKGGFVVEDVTFKRVTSSGHKTDGNFLCTKASPCRGMVLEDVSLDGDKKWQCKDAYGKSKSGCDCFTGATGSASHVTPDIGSCLGK